MRSVRSVIADLVGENSDELNVQEQETLRQWERSIKEAQVDLDDVADWMYRNILSVSEELCDNEVTTRENILKGRLRAYIQLYKLLTRAKEAERAMAKQLEHIHD